MQREAVPQLWAVGEQSDLSPEIAALAEAQLSEVGLADRVRGATGQQVRVLLPDEPVAGRVVAVHRDAMVVATGLGECLVRLPHVMAVTVPAPTPPVAPLGRERASGLTVIRDWVGRRAVVRMSQGRLVGRLLNCGADHLALESAGGTQLVPWDVVVTILVD